MSNDVENSSNDLIQIVSFKLGEEEFGVDILKIQEINRMIELTKVPQAPHFVEGVINLRGNVIPVIDIRKKFEMPSIERDKDTRIVVCNVDGNIIGMIVDAVSEVLRFPESTIEPAPKIVSSINSDYLKGVAKLDNRLLLFLDISKIAGDANQIVETDTIEVAI